MGRFLIKRYAALSLTAFVAISFTGAEASDQSIPFVKEGDSDALPIAAQLSPRDWPLQSWKALYDKIMNYPPEEVINTPTL